MNKMALAAVLSTLVFGTVSVSLAAEAPHDFGVTTQKGDGPQGIHKGGKKDMKKDMKKEKKDMKKDMKKDCDGDKC